MIFDHKDFHITNTCPKCGTTTTMRLNNSEIIDYLSNYATPVFALFPDMDIFEKEFLALSYCPECTAKLFRMKDYKLSDRFVREEAIANVC